MWRFPCLEDKPDCMASLAICVLEPAHQIVKEKPVLFIPSAVFG